MPVKVITEFDFREFLSSGDFYKQGIRNKGGALSKIKKVSPLGEEEVKIVLAVTRRFDSEAEKLVLVFREENRIYNVPVSIKSREEEGVYILKKQGKVLYIEDQRSYERIELNKKVEYYVIDKIKTKINNLRTGVVEDISASGAKLITTRDLDTRKSIVLNTTFMELPFDKLTGKIVWKEEGDGGRYYNGIQFKFDNEEKQQKLIDYLY